MASWRENLRHHLLDGPLRALHAPNFRIFYFGQAVSLVGSWMTRVAMGWLVYRLTDSALLLGVVGFAGQIPAFFLAPIAGWLADRVSKWRILVITQTLAMLQSFALAALTLSGAVRIWHLVVLAAFQGFVDAFDMTTRQSFVVEMVDRREDLPNAIALNSMSFNAARMIGPSVAGILIGLWNEGACFLIDGVSYLAVLVSLFRMAVPPFIAASGAPSLRRGLGEGFRYAFASPTIRSVLLSIALLGTVGMSYSVIMPVIARDVLGGGAHTLGFLLSAVGVGALAGGVYLASSRSIQPAGPEDQHRRPRRGFLAGGAGPVPIHLAVAGPDVPDRPLLHGPDGLGQHLHPDHRRRRQARPGDEPLHHGLHGLGAPGQPAHRPTDGPPGGPRHLPARRCDVFRLFAAAGAGVPTRPGQDG